MPSLLSFCLVATLIPPLQADPRAEAIAPFVGDEVAAVLHLDLTELDPNALARQVLEGVLEAREIDAATESVNGWVESLRKAGAKDLYVLVDPLDLPNPPSVIVPMVEGADAEAIGRVLCGEGEEPSAFFAWPTCATVKGAVFAGTDEALERIRQPNPAPRPELAAAFAASSEQASAHILIIPSATQRRVLEEMIPTLPEELGKAPMTTLTRGMQWALIALETDPKATLRVVVQSPDAESAKAVQQLAQNGLNFIVQNLLQGQEPLQELAKALEPLRPEVADDQVVLAIDLEQASALLGVPLRQARTAATRAQSMNNLKQIALAMHNYHDQNKAFPPAYSQDEEGKPLLSWRVHILPYIEQQALYEEFHLDEPWDSSHNKALIERMPPPYSDPNRIATEETAGRTRYLVPRSEETIFPGGEGITIRDITDGTSNTIMVVEVSADHAVIWTKPDDWEVGEQVDLSVLFDKDSEGTNAAFADGSARFLPKSIDPEIIRKLITRAGGEVVGPY